MNDWRQFPVIGCQRFGVDSQGPFLKTVISPHGDIFMDFLAIIHRNGLGQIQHLPECIDPGTCADDDIVGLNHSPVGNNR